VRGERIALLGLDVEQEQARQRRAARRLEVAVEHRAQLRHEAHEQRAQTERDEARHGAQPTARKLARAARSGRCVEPREQRRRASAMPQHQRGRAEQRGEYAAVASSARASTRSPESARPAPPERIAGELASDGVACSANSCAGAAAR
jgi:hypothetical protein